MNNFAIETAQSLFENMLNVPQSELETTVMRFREEVKNLGEPERFAVTGDLVLRVQELAWELGDRFHLDYCTTLDELEFSLLDCESQLTEKEKRVFDWFMFFQYPWPNGAPNCVLFLVSCFEDKLFFMTPDIILGENKMEDLNHMIVMLKSCSSTFLFRIFKRLLCRCTVMRSVACTRFWTAISRHVLVRCRTLTRWQVMSAVRIPPPLLMRCSVCITL